MTDFPERSESYKGLQSMFTENFFDPMKTLNLADHGNQMYKINPGVLPDMVHTPSVKYRLAELTKGKQLMEVLEFLKGFTVLIREQKNANQSSADPCFYLSEMCDEMVEYYTDVCDLT